MYNQDQSQRPQRPKLQSFQAYESFSPSTPSGPGQLVASCRALQSMLEGPTQPVQSSSRRPSYHSNLLLSISTLQSPLLTPPCSLHKRGREEYEEDSMMSDIEDTNPNRERNMYQMAKKQRSTGVDLPLYPHMADLRALRSPRTPQLSQMMDTEMCLTLSQDVLELDPVLQHLSHTQLLPVQTTIHQSFSASGHDCQLADTAFAGANQSTGEHFSFPDSRGQQKMHFEQQWTSFGGEGKVGLPVR